MRRTLQRRAAAAAVLVAAVMLGSVASAYATDVNEHDWQQLDGLGTVVHSPQRVVLDGETAFDRFNLYVATGTDGRVWQSYAPDGAVQWQPMPNSPVTRASPVAVFAAGHVFVFVTLPDGHVQYTTTTARTGFLDPWSPWLNAPSNVLTDPDLSVAASGGGRVDLAWTGTNGRIYTNYLLTSLHWGRSNPTTLPGATTRHSPAITFSEVDGRTVLWVMYAGTNTGSNVWLSASTNLGATWLPSVLFGNARTENAPAATTTSQYPNSTQIVSVLGTDGHIWYNEDTHGMDSSSEEGWSRTSGSVTTTAPPSMATEFELDRNGFSALWTWVVVRGPDGHIWGKILHAV